MKNSGCRKRHIINNRNTFDTQTTPPTHLILSSMETLKSLLAINPNYIAIVLMVLFYSLEQILITQFNFTKRPHHLFQSVLFQVTFYFVGILWATVTVFTISWLNQKGVGLFYLVHVPLWFKVVIGVLLYDFTSYWFHRAAHRIPLIWRLHRVHHMDTSMDASSNFRNHPLDFVWFGISNIAAAAIFGLDLFGLSVYFLIATPLFFMEHSNLKFPTWLDKTVGLVFTTPNLHKIHHEQDQYYTDSNYADILILWDKLFGSFKYKPVADIKLGLKEFDTPRQQTFWYGMISPFVKNKSPEIQSEVVTDINEV